MARWNIERKSIFKKQYKNIGHARQTNVDKAILELATSLNPASIGTYKQNKKVFAYKLDKNDRLIYTLDYLNNKITLHRVCDHKSAYGKD